MNLVDVISDLISRTDEEEWFEFKVDWFEEERIGHYISALSNSAAIVGKDYGYLVWGIDDKTHEVVGTSVNPFGHYKSEPLQNYLARNLKPSIAFRFQEVTMNGKRVVALVIPSAKTVPTAFNKIRYSRIGSSIASLEKYPEREGLLWNVLLRGYPTMVNTESPVQGLTFNQLKTYYLGKGLLFNDATFKVNMHLFCPDGKYNMLACFLADNGEIPVRVAIFSGSDKASKLFSVKEFGNQSLVSVIDRIIDYSDTINMPKAVENVHTGIRTDVPLFNQDCFNEAVKNAFIHNSWLRRTAPMITFFDDRVEITSFSSLAPSQTVEGFYNGRSVPVNEELSSIFLATHLSERTGKGNPLIVSYFGRKAFKIGEDCIVVTIPYNWKHSFKDEMDKIADRLSKTEMKILFAIRENPRSTQDEISEVANVSLSTVQKAMKKFRKSSLIVRVGSNKAGYWKIVDADD